MYTILYFSVDGESPIAILQLFRVSAKLFPNHFILIYKINKMEERSLKPVFVVDGNFAHLWSSRCPLSVCAYLQDKGLHLQILDMPLDEVCSCLLLQSGTLISSPTAKETRGPLHHVHTSIPQHRKGRENMTWKETANKR